MGDDILEEIEMEEELNRIVDESKQAMEKGTISRIEMIQVNVLCAIASQLLRLKDSIDAVGETLDDVLNAVENIRTK